jgi:hypothetical protein
VVIIVLGIIDMDRALLNQDGLPLLLESNGEKHDASYQGST